MAKKYKVRLKSGRILGPLDREKLARLVLKNRIVGTESARTHPVGEWQDINSFPELAEVFIAKLEGKLKPDESGDLGYTSSGDPGGLTAAVLPTVKLDAPAESKHGKGTVATKNSHLSIPSIQLPTATGLESSPQDEPSKVELERQPPVEGTRPPEPPREDEGTPSGTQLEVESEERTEMYEPTPSGTEVEMEIDRAIIPRSVSDIAREKTVVFQRAWRAPVESTQMSRRLPGKKRISLVQWLKVAAIGLSLGFVSYDFIFPEDREHQTPKPTIIRPVLPDGSGTPDPERSQKLYERALSAYSLDTVRGYKTAAQLLLQSASLDMNNVKALGFLASSYINLIDVSNKDEKYFSVISQLIDLSRSKSMDLPETVIADVEFYITVNRAEAAQQRIVDYTKTHPKFPAEMFYYLAAAFYARGDYHNAAKYILGYPEKQYFSPKVAYLRGLVAEKLNDPENAQRYYEKALEISKGHLKSRLRLADLLARQGKLGSSAPHLKYIAENSLDLAPADLASAYFLYSQYHQLNQRIDDAIFYIERAIRLDRQKHEYLFELYTLRARAGDRVSGVKKEARMYEFLSQGERLLKEGNTKEALARFIEARQANLDSLVPLIKIGDLFMQLKDIANARYNYQLAAEKAPDNIGVWSKYIDTLIQSYDWEGAQKAMDKFRQLPVSQSAIDKAAGDLYAKQGDHANAQTHYRKAMSRESIDPTVYIAYADSLVASKNYKDAPFFYALALRFDPLNMDAIIGTARATAASESIDRAVTMLRDELEKVGGNRAELLAAIAELEIQRGEWSVGQQFVEQAIAANPDYAYPWKLQARIHMHREGVDKNALDRALEAYKSYSDRNLSDPSGYLERYKVFIKKSDFQKAGQELERIYAMYPKYPNLHYFRGALYGTMGNHQVAVDEFVKELANNPNSVNTLLALGRELIEVGAPDKAISYLNKAIALAPQAAEPRHQAAHANHMMKNYPAAIALYRAALGLDPGNPLLYKKLGMVYRDAGDRDEARQAFRKYLEMEPDAADRREFEKYL